MSLSVGTRLGVYEFTAAIGAGGMGEVYRARDTSLNRDVAIKILPAAVATDPDRLARFRREAEVLAALNHPSIAHVYGVESSSAGPALVMEFVDGKTLDEVIAGRPMPWDDVLPIAKQVADALECAHERGIIHRDLKPANVKITNEGIVKVLDFGLAKAVSPELTSPSNIADSPTLTARATAIGVILGTAAYMSPEQAKGRPVDRRADIWAFGAVLFEMLAGRRAFDGDDVTEVIAAAIKTEPPWDALPSDTPAAVTRLVRRCLTKDPKKRLRDIAEGMLQLDEGFSQPPAAIATPSAATTRPLWRRATPVIAAVLITALAVSAMWMLNRRPETTEPLRVTLTAPGLTVSENPRPRIGMTLDGRIVYRSGGIEPGKPAEIMVKQPDQFEAEPLAGAGSATTPFMSPDGEWVGFLHSGQPDNALFKVPIRGGPRTPIATAPVPRVYGVAWAPDGAIVFGTTQGLFKIAPGRDTPVPLTTSAGAFTGWHAWPTVVASTGLVVFTIRRGDEGTLAAVSMATGAITPLPVPGTFPRYLPTGHLAYATADGVLRAVPFDASRIAVTGPSIPMESGVFVSPVSGVAEFDVSSSGTLAYISAQQPMRALVWVEPRKGEMAIPAPAGSYSYPRLSPDHQRMSVAERPRETNIMSWEFARPGLRPLVRNTEAAGEVLWANDGTMFYSMSRDGKSAIYRQNADGTGQPFKVVESDRSLQTWAIVPDRSKLVIRHGNELALVNLAGEPRIETLVSGVTNGSLSPNGAWIAYESAGREVIVRPFPRVNEGSWPISSGQGIQPLWSRDGRELFYVASGNMMSAPVVEGRTFSTGAPKTLFPTRDYFLAGLGRSFDVSKDGRFLMMKSLDSPDPVIKVVFNWFGEVSARVKPR